MSNDVTTMVKKVNVIAPIPIRTVNPVIYGKKEGLSMTPANILKCIIGRATVYEVLSDGSKIRLNINNYNKVNKPVKPFIRAKAPELEKKPVSAIANNEIKKSMVLTKDINNMVETIKEDKSIFVYGKDYTDRYKEKQECVDAEAELDKEFSEVKAKMLDANSVSTGININYMLDVIKDENGNPIEVPAVNIIKPGEIKEDKCIILPQIGDPGESKIVTMPAITKEEEEDPELAELAAEIAKLEAEEAAKKDTGDY